MLDIAENTSKIESGPLFSTAHVAERRRAEAWLADRIKRGLTGIFYEVVELTPVIAELLLERNPHNRVVKNAVLVKYEADIKSGAWELNGESIKVSRCGSLNDGQHRCAAVIRAGTSINTVITFGLDRDSRLTLDQGALRTGGDYLGMDGVENANHAASVAGLVWQFDNRGAVVSGHSDNKPTKAQVQEAYHLNVGISDSIRFAQKKGVRLIGGISVVAFAHFIFARKQPGLADAFIRTLISGESISRGNPIYTARQLLLTDRKMKLEQRAEIIFVAWNAYFNKARLFRVHLNGGALPKVEG